MGDRLDELRRQAEEALAKLPPEARELAEELIAADAEVERTQHEAEEAMAALTPAQRERVRKIVAADEKVAKAKEELDRAKAQYDQLGSKIDRMGELERQLPGI